MNSGIPLVSIICTTYNHEEYVKDALEGFVMQKTKFSFEIIIHDDASNDNTVSIIKEYKNKYPELIKPIYQIENQFSKGVNIWQMLFKNYCKGKYIAICEGDDYWIDSLKLQKQVDFLETHSEYCICHHRMLIKKDMLQRLTSLPSQNSTSQLDLAKTNYIYTASVMFRNHIDKIDMSPFNSCPVGDYVLFMLLSNYGKIMFLPETMGCYRMHNGGVWGKKSSIYQYSNWLKVIELLIHEFRGKVLSILIRQYYLCVCKLAAKQFFQYEFRAGVKTLKLLLKKF